VKSSLIQLFEKQGVLVQNRRGQDVAMSFLGASKEVDSARSGTALTWHGAVSRIHVTGRHRLRFIHNMTTCQIKELQTGQGNYGLVVNDGGKLVVQFFVEAEEDALVLEFDPAGYAGALAQLKKYIIADDVKFAEPVSMDLLTLVGPTADDVMSQFGLKTDHVSIHAWSDISIGSETCRVRRNNLRLGGPSWDVLVPHAGASIAWSALEAAGATPVGFDAWEFLRIQYGWPLTGVDVGDENIPLESDRLAATIDWDKGCYIGQEVIAMMHYRGRPNKHLGRIQFTEAPKEGEPGTPLSNSAGKVVGRLGSSITTPEGCVVALAVIKRRHADDDASFTTPCGTAGNFHRFPKYVVD
jgi:tRNA-modifying protein YgfZ